MKATTIKTLTDRSPGLFQINAGQKIYLAQIPKISTMEDLLNWIDHPIQGIWISGMGAPQKEQIAPDSILDIFPLESLINTDKVTAHDTTTASSTDTTAQTSANATPGNGTIRRRATAGTQANGDQGQART